jgi:hypothetical protein
LEKSDNRFRDHFLIFQCLPYETTTQIRHKTTTYRGENLLNPPRFNETAEVAPEYASDVDLNNSMQWMLY